MAEHEEPIAVLNHQFDDVKKGQYSSERDITGAELKDYTVHEVGVVDHSVTADGDEPTEEEKKTLRRIGEWLPIGAWLVASVELCERFTFYGISGLFQNYIDRPLDGSEGRGALGLGGQAATGLNTFFQFWAYVTPIMGAIIADQYLGKYKTIVIFVSVYILGLLILLLTSLPVSLEAGAGVGGFITSIIVIGLGTGGIKSNVAPLIADQYTRRKQAVSTLASGERVIIDPAITIQRIYMIFYLCINIGSLSLIATPYMEADIGFWSAFLLGLAVFLIGFLVLILGRKQYVVRPPQGSIITNAFRAVWQMMINRNSDAPKPSVQAAKGLTPTTRWDDQFIDELKRALIACRVFIFYPVFWVAYSQFSSNFVTQAGQMDGHGIPNDFMQNFDPLAIIVVIPILDRLVYPLLRKWRINFYPISRITTGFWVAALAMAYAAIVQHLIYTSPPCYEKPLCPASAVDGVRMGNKVHIAIQTPAYVLIGLSEIFISVTGLEYAYTKAPPSMKSFVQSIYLLTNAFGSAINEALVSVAVDPKYQWLYVGISVAAFITGCFFYFIFRHLNAQEEALNAIDKDDPFQANRNMSVHAQEDVSYTSSDHEKV